MKILLLIILSLSFSLQQDLCESRDTDDNCERCPAGYYITQDRTACENCSFGCTKCNSSQICSECDEFNYLTEEYTCDFCANKYSDCRFCSPTECFACNPGHYIFEGECFPCSERWLNCSNCTKDKCIECNSTSCPEACEYHQILLNNACVDCKIYIPNCERCFKTDQCEECDEYHYIEATKQECLPCSNKINFCEKCDSASNCTKCSEGYSLRDSSCYAELLESTYFDEETRNTLPCYSKFDQCEYCTANRCISCLSPFKLEGEECVPVNSSVSTSFVLQGREIPCSDQFPGCKYCNSNGCIGCTNSDLIDFDGNCINDCSVSNCTKCSRQRCVQCLDDSFALNGDACSRCGSLFVGCEKCSIDGCKQCGGEQILEKGQCRTEEEKDSYLVIFIIAGIGVLVLVLVCGFIACKLSGRAKNKDKGPNSRVNNAKTEANPLNNARGEANEGNENNRPNQANNENNRPNNESNRPNNGPNQGNNRPNQANNENNRPNQANNENNRPNQANTGSNRPNSEIPLVQPEREPSRASSNNEDEAPVALN